MAVLSLKTELDVAELLLTKGWLPEEINSILVFPLPNTIFRHLSHKNGISTYTNVAKATAATPTTIYRARQLLEAAGWLERELNSLLKPYLYGNDAWANQSIHSSPRCPSDTSLPTPLCWSNPAQQVFPLRHRRRTMALRRISSLALVIALVAVAVVLLA